MSEYWVSKKRYYCKYCEIYITDDAPSRQQHENGLRHKGSKDRFIRELYKAGEKKKKDKQEEEREMKKVEAAAQAAFAKDIGAAPPEPTPSASTSRKPPPPKPSDPWANYTTAAQLGIVDEDAERRAAEFQIRQTEGRASEWEIVAPPLPTLKRERSPSPNHVVEAEAEEDTRRFKVRQKSAKVGLGEIWDPGEIKIKKKDEAPAVKKEEEIQASQVPQWTPVQWSRGEPRATSTSQEDGGNVEQEEGVTPAETATATAQPEEPANPNGDSIKQEVEETKPTDAEATAEDSGSFFKKRKIKGSSTVGKGRRAF
ncbi:hypothetical protein FRC02_001758 [Tulasnella sp. 418]|nr:hypothetical protein FRC02_001758 [Tulasnella sp. 418]